MPEKVSRISQRLVLGLTLLYIVTNIVITSTNEMKIRHEVGK